MGADHSTEIFYPGELEDDFRRHGGEGDATLWELFRAGYNDVVNAIIRPPRQKYEISDLGPIDYELPINSEIYITIHRNDFILKNSRGLKLQCSHWDIVQSNPTDSKRPCLLYLHSNLGSRLDILPFLSHALKAGFSVFTFDFCGCGKSDGLFVTLGWNESKDLETIIQYLESLQTVSSIFIYGHNMGAAAAMLYMGNTSSTIKPSTLIKGMILDGAFITLEKLSIDLLKAIRREGVPAPLSVLKAGVRLVRSSVERRADFTMKCVRPIESGKSCTIPALFISGKQDQYVGLYHPRMLQKAYRGFAYTLYFEGDHFGPRPTNVINICIAFMYELIYPTINNKNNLEKYYSQTYIKQYPECEKDWSHLVNSMHSFVPKKPETILSLKNLKLHGKNKNKQIN